MSAGNEEQGRHLPSSRLKALRAAEGKAVFSWEADGAF